MYLATALPMIKESARTRATTGRRSFISKYSAIVAKKLYTALLHFLYMSGTVFPLKPTF
jgi:NO-binding membrane sensor protein with MHYT domain